MLDPRQRPAPAHRGGAAGRWPLRPDFRLAQVVCAATDAGAAEAAERLPDATQINRGGRPRKFDRPLAHTEALANGITMQAVYHEDGYAIRLRGRVVDAEMADLMMDQLRRLLSPLPVHKLNGS